MDYFVESIRETKEFAKKFAENLKGGDVVGLYGDLGSGKTTFTRYLVEALGMGSRVQSPTFVIVRQYGLCKESDFGNKSGTKSNTNTSINIGMRGQEEITCVNHIDLYRLQTVEGVEDLGLKEYFEKKGSISIVEWPEIAEGLLPKNIKKLYFEYAGENKRKIKCINCE